MNTHAKCTGVSRDYRLYYLPLLILMLFLPVFPDVLDKKEVDKLVNYLRRRPN